MKSLLLAVSILLPIVSSCDVMKQTVAERCVYVDLYGQKGKALFPILDAFAEQNNLVPGKSHPINPRYTRLDDDGALTGEVSYLIGVGEFGAELALFRFDKSQSADLLAAFDRLVEKEIAPNYKVTQCTEDQFPTAYR